MSKGRIAAGKTCRIFGTVLLLAIVLICLPLAGPRLLGYQAYVITSGSMEPAIPTGSAVYVKNVSPEEIEIGDVIVFYGGHDGEAITTHRVVENHISEREFITRGDANDGNDMLPRSYENLIGRVDKSIPFLGIFLATISGRQGRLSLAGFLAAAVLLRILGGRLERSSEEEADS